MSAIIKKYDFIMSIGRFCHCTAMLNNHGLKLFDGPWDWSGTGRVEGIYKRLDALTNGFDGWFNREDFVHFEEPDSLMLTDFTDPNALRPHKEIKSDLLPEIYSPMCWFYNKSTLTYYGHDFKSEATFDSQWEEFIKKYKRRIYRTESFINASDKILLVYMSHIADQKRDLPLDFNIVIELMKNIRKRYPGKEIDLYMFTHRNDIKGDLYFRQVWDVGIVNYFSNHENVFPAKDSNISHQANGFMMPKSICKILEKIALTDKFNMI